MKTIEISLYKFDELSEAAQQNAIENQRNSEYNVDLEFFNEDTVEQIIAAGFKGNVKLQYSLSYSQGDGLSFSCDYFDKLNELFVEVLGTGKQKTIDCIINNCSFENKGNNGRYCYASRNDISFEFDDYSANKPLIHDIVSQVETKIKDIYIDLCNELEKNGYKYIEYENSDECIIENLIGNEYDFTENGQMY